MNPWKSALAKLSDAGQFLAHWHLQSGASFYMYVPRRMDMGSDTLKPDYDVRFEEIARLDILQVLRLGGLDATNDIDACRRVLGSDHEVGLREVEGGIQLSWHGIKVH